MTAANAVVGTPNYVAPELVLARRDYDGKVDQYSLAVTVYEVLAGKPPLEGGSPTATMVNQTTMHARALNERNPAVPVEIATAVRLAMSKRPWRRYDSCVAFADAVLAPLDSSGHSDITSSSRSSATGYSTVIEDRPDLFVAGVSRGTGGDIPCPSCGKTIALKARYAGQRGACVHCKAQLLISHDLNELHWLKKVELAASDGSLAVQPATPCIVPSAEDAVGEARLLGLRFSSRRAMWWTLTALAGLLIAAVFVGRQTVKLPSEPVPLTASTLPTE
jgi:serine/threonine-protein kinase